MNALTASPQSASPTTDHARPRHPRCRRWRVRLRRIDIFAARNAHVLEASFKNRSPLGQDNPSRPAAASRMRVDRPALCQTFKYRPMLACARIETRPSRREAANAPVAIENLELTPDALADRAQSFTWRDRALRGTRRDRSGSLWSCRNLHESPQPTTLEHSSTARPARGAPPLVQITTKKLKSAF